MNNPDDLVYTVVGNSSNTIGMNITSNGTDANVCFAINYKPDNFTIILMDKVEKEVIQVVHHGGSSRTYYKNVTEYIEVPVKEIVYIDNSTSEDCDPIIIEEKKGWFKRFIEWIKGLFTKE